MAAGLVRFAVQNLAALNGEAVLFTGGQPNKLVLQIRNIADREVIRLDPKSRLTVRLDSLLSRNEIALIAKQSGSDWDGGPAELEVPTEDGKTTKKVLLFELRPKGELRIKPTESLRIEIDNVIVSGAMTSGYFEFSSEGFKTGLDVAVDGTQRCTVFRHRPPVEGQTDWPLALGFSPRRDYGNDSDTIYVTPWSITPGKAGIANSFLLNLTNSGSPIPLPEHGSTPTIVISFVTETGESALCRDEQLKDVTATVVQADQGYSWTSTKNDSGPAPTWTITPGNHNPKLLGQAGGLTLRFVTLVSQDDRVVKDESLRTPVFVQFGGLDKYNDGFLVAWLYKTAPVPHVRFKALANGTIIASNATIEFARSLQLSWDVFAAEDCLLRDEAHPDEPIQVGCVEQGRTIAARPKQSYTLQPRIGGELLPGHQVDFHITPPAVAPLTATQEPGEPHTHVTLNWICRSGECVLYADDVKIAEYLPLQGSRMVPTAVSTTYKIECNGTATVSSSIQVDVPPPPAGFINAYSYSNVVTGRRETRLAWLIANAATCSIVNLDNGREISQSHHGSWDDPETTDSRRFELAALGNGKLVLQTTATDEPCFRATADGKLIDYGQTIDFIPVQLEWDVSGAETCLLQVGSDPSARVPVACVGSKPLQIRTPQQSYTLFAGIGSDIVPVGEVAFFVTPAVVDSITYTFNPFYGTVSWACHNGSHCVLYLDGNKLFDDLPLKGWRSVGRGQSDVSICCIGAGETWKQPDQLWG